MVCCPCHPTFFYSLFILFLPSNNNKRKNRANGTGQCKHNSHTPPIMSDKKLVSPNHFGNKKNDNSFNRHVCRHNPKTILAKPKVIIHHGIHKLVASVDGTDQYRKQTRCYNTHKGIYIKHWRELAKTVRTQGDMSIPMSRINHYQCKNYYDCQ